MSKRRSVEPVAIGVCIPDEVLGNFVCLGRQLAAQMARETFQVVTATPGWTPAHIEVATEVALERLEAASRNALADTGGAPSGKNWRIVLTTMEASYRETMAALLQASERRSGRALQ